MCEFIRTKTITTAGVRINSHLQMHVISLIRRTTIKQPTNKKGFLAEALLFIASQNRI